MSRERVNLDAANGQVWSESALRTAREVAELAWALPLGVHHEAALSNAILQAALTDLGTAWKVPPSQIVPINGLLNAFEVASRSTGGQPLAISKTSRQGMKRLQTGGFVEVDSSGQTLASSVEWIGYAAVNPETGIIDHGGAAHSKSIVDATEWAGHLPSLPTGEAVVVRASAWAGPANCCFVIFQGEVPISLKERLNLAPDPSLVAAAAAAWQELGDLSARASLQSEWLQDFQTELARFDWLRAVVGPELAPHLLTLQVLNRSGEALARKLDELGIAVGSQSACDVAGIAASEVLEAMGITPAESIRISLPLKAQQKDLEQLLEALSKV